MDKVSVRRELLIQMLSEAYSAGWHGSLEGKTSAVDNIISKHVPKKIVTDPKSELLEYFSANHPIFSLI